jgi:HK97 family phage major capsid protein
MATLTRDVLRSEIGDVLKDVLGQHFGPMKDQQAEQSQGGTVHVSGPEPFSPAQQKYLEQILSPFERREYGGGTVQLSSQFSQQLSDSVMRGMLPGLLAQGGQASLIHNSTMGFRAARVCRLFAATKGDPDRMVQAYTKLYGEDPAVTKALSSNDGTAGGFLIEDQLAEEVIEFLRAASVIRQLNPTMMPLPGGRLDISKIPTGANASYIGENDNAPYSEAQFGMVSLSAHDLAVLVAISNNLLNRTGGSADRVVRDDLVNAMAVRSDQAFIRDNGTINTPRGLRYWAPSANVIAANGTVNLANVTVDLGKLMLALMGSNVRMLRPGWIFAPRIFIYLTTVRDTNGNFAFRDEMINRRQLWGYPYGVTTNVPINLGGGSNESEVYFADFADVVIGEENTIQLASSDTAAYHDGSAVQAAFSRNQSVIRAIANHDLVMRHAESVAVLTTVTWA